MKKQPGLPTKISVAEIVELTRGTDRSITFRGSDNRDSNRLSSASFGYDHHQVGLKSTQQLNVDWTKFENHTFFNSAVAKINVAFDKIVNGYPFDGSKKELEKYVDDLTGYEKHVLDSFPHNVGYLNFSGSWIEIADYQGGAFPELSKNKTGESVLDPKLDPFTVEFQLFVPQQSAGTQVIYQKQSLDNVGVSAYVKSGSSSANAELAWAVYSGSYGLIASATIQRGRFNHLACAYDRESTGKTLLYVNGILAGQSDSSYALSSVRAPGTKAMIGSGSAFNVGSLTITPQITLSGSLDELRVFKQLRSLPKIQRYASRNTLSEEDLLLCYRFNEPSGSLSGNDDASIDSVVLDSSGNGLHANITNFTHTLRNTGSLSSPLSNERRDLNPVLFPGFSDVRVFNTDLVASGTRYDLDNPNLITRLVPKHYLIEGQEQDGLTNEVGTLSDSYAGDSVPGTGQLGSTQLLVGLLYTWAKYFDELKLFVDSFATLHYADYSGVDTTPDVFLPLAFEQMGVKLPSLFSDATFSQFNDGEDVETSFSLNERSLNSVQNQIMRRVLINFNEIIRSKGTLHSLKSFFRSIGIDPNNSFKIKEKGGPTKRSISELRETRLEPIQFLDFSSGGLATSRYLSSSRIEVGVPTIAGTMVQASTRPPHGVSNQVNDGLWTSGSWTHEGTYAFSVARPHAASQSLCRMHVTGTSSPTSKLVANLVATSGSAASLHLLVRAGNGSTLAASPLLTMSLNVDLFDGSPWHVCFGRHRNDLTGSGLLSSSYFVQADKQVNGALIESRRSVAYAIEAASPSVDLWKTVSTTANASGTFLVYGSSSLTTGSSCLNDDALVPQMARATSFDGSLTRQRFWSRALTPTECREHALNFGSLGVDNPSVGFNFVTSESGSWQRLRIDASIQQDTTRSASDGTLTLFDYSQNNAHIGCTSFPTSSVVVKPTILGYSHVSPNFDEAVSSNKVRVRSYQHQDSLVGSPWAQIGPTYEVPKNEEPQDDPRLSIEFSLIDALNRDMILMFSTMDELDLALGATNNEFSSEYGELEHLRQVYFSRLTEKLNFKAFFEFFRWFDSSVSKFVEYLIPRKTIFKGTNFVVESHMLERHKKQYFHYDMYLREASRTLLEHRILLQQIQGVSKKY